MKIKTKPVDERLKGLPAPAIISSSIKQPHISPSLLGIPHELRLQIYGYLTHMPDLLRPGWRYSPCLIYICRQIYHETILLLYQSTMFTFSSPDRCLEFLNPIGYNLKYVRCLEIRYEEKQLPQLEEICRRLGEGSHLHTLEVFEVQMGGRAHPIRNHVRFTAFGRDLDETNHPLGILRQMRLMNVQSAEVQDFDQRLRNLMEKLLCTEHIPCLTVISPWFAIRPTYMVGETENFRNGNEFGGHCFYVHDSRPSSK